MLIVVELSLNYKNKRVLSWRFLHLLIVTFYEAIHEAIVKYISISSLEYSNPHLYALCLSLSCLLCMGATDILFKLRFNA